MNADVAPKCILGLDISPTEEGYIIYQPELDRVHYLNHSAVLILELSTGRNTAGEIANLVQEAYSLPEPPVAAVLDMIAKLNEQGLLHYD